MSRADEDRLRRPPRPAAPLFENRWATVVFADVSGFTRMGGDMDAADLMKVTNRCLDTMEEEVVRFGGYPVKRIGDCLMALFGAPKALENAPRAAVTAAIEMRTRVLGFAAQAGRTLNIHTGVNTGEVAVGVHGGIYDAFGNTVNIAQRLEDAAPPGAIYVSPSSYRATRDDFEYQATKRHLELKNVKRPMPAYEVLSHRRSRESEGFHSALVGRQVDLERLREALRALAGGQGGIAVVLGEAGLGKSRLVAEMLALEEGKGATRLEARSLAVGRNLPFHPIQDLLRRWSGIGVDDDQSTASRKLEAAVGSLLGTGASEVFPFVARLMNMRLTAAAADRLAGIEGEALETLIVKSMRDLVLALASRQPLIVVFEDLHWADESSVKLLHALLRLVLDAPILVVLVARGDQPHNTRRVLETARTAFAAHLVEVRLEPLTARQCHDLLEDLVRLDDLPQAVRSLICERSGGNPFYLEEVLRSLMEDDPARFRTDEAAEEAVRAVPGSIQEIIMSRIERLPSSTQGLVQVAAVIGRSLPYRVIECVTGREHRQLESELQRLVRGQIIRRQTAQGEVEYVFIHALVQETIYDGTAKEKRLALHGKVAETIEALFGAHMSGYFGMLAYHYSRAKNLEKAEDFLFKAGTEAARAAAPAEALQFFEEASRIYLALHRDGGDPRRKALLEKNIGLALLHKGDLLDSIDHFNKSLEWLGERVPAGAVALWMRFLVDLGLLLLRLYSNRLSARMREEDREVLEIRYNRARAQTTTDARRWVFDTIGSVRRLSATNPHAIERACGMYAGAAALFAFSGLSFAISRRFLLVAERLVRDGNVRDIVLYRVMRFIVHYLEGSWGEEFAIDDDLIEQGLRYGELWDIDTYIDMNCEKKLRQGDWAEAERLLRKLDDIANVYGYGWARTSELGRAAELLLEQRKLPEARHAIDVYDAGRIEKTLNLWALAIRAKTQALLGDRDGARATLAVANGMLRKSRQVPAYHLSAYLASRLLLDVSELEESMKRDARVALRDRARLVRRSARRALRIASKVAAVRPEIYRLAARLFWLIGKPARAGHWWGRAIAECERLGALPELGRTYMEAGQLMSADPGRLARLNGASAGTCLEKARGLFAELGLEWDRDQLGGAGLRAA